MQEFDESVPVKALMNPEKASQKDSSNAGDEIHITVVVRCRPLFENEKRPVGNFTRTTILRIQDNMLFLQDPYEGIDSKVERTREERMYEFDACFDGTATNSDVCYSTRVF